MGGCFGTPGGGRFADVTRTAGIAQHAILPSAPRGSITTATASPTCSSATTSNGRRTARSTARSGGVRGYCGPDAYRPRAPKLYRNRGGGRFEDVTRAAGLAEPIDKAMGVAVLDHDMDGWPDVFVGSDRVPAQAVSGTIGRGGFVEGGVPAGVALSENGRARANMGVDARRLRPLGTTRISSWATSRTRCSGCTATKTARAFVDVAPRSEVGRASLLYVTWAVFFLDYDLDGFLDIFAVNGGTDESQGRDARARVSQPPLHAAQPRERHFRKRDAAAWAPR